MITIQELEKRIKAKKSMTALELDELLQSCPEWVEQNRQREEQHQALVERQKEETRAENEPLLRDLATVGRAVNSVWDLVNTTDSYPEAIPVLLQHLPIVKHPVERQGIARALAVPEARGVAGEVLLNELRQETDSETRWILANTLTVAAGRNNADQIQALADDPAYKDVRERLEEALKKLRSGSNGGSETTAR